MTRYSNVPLSTFPAMAIEVLSGGFGKKLDGWWMTFDNAAEEDGDTTVAHRGTLRDNNYRHMTLFVKWCEEQV